MAGMRLELGWWNIQRPQPAHSHVAAEFGLSNWERLSRPCAQLLHSSDPASWQSRGQDKTAHILRMPAWSEV